MRISTTLAEEALSRVFAAIPNGDDALRAALDALQAPIYVTDAEGIVTHFNQACIGFAGRYPKVGKDRWCVTWRLFTTEGEFLPHAQCPMALAIRGKRPVRGLLAIAERPDGTRVTFAPFPTPFFSGGELVGAVNILIDISDARQVEALRKQAASCRRLSHGIGDRQTADTLKAMAADYEAKATELEERLGYTVS